MTPAPSLAVARRYHDGWTTGHYEQATDLLSPSVKIEVPINDYPTPESFGQALCRFGELVRSVELLSEMGEDDEAMLLYDMDVEKLGQLRVAEHFTITDGKITRLRQIHDTAPVRAAGLAQPTSGGEQSNDTPAEDDYVREVPYETTPDRMFDALTTLDGLRRWWTPLVSGVPTAGARLEFRFKGIDEVIVMHVEEATRPVKVIWTCVIHSGHPEWEGTKVTFELTKSESGVELLKFRHAGLNPTLSCYRTCETGWDHFLSSLVDYAETGAGSPF